MDQFFIPNRAKIADVGNRKKVMKNNIATQGEGSHNDLQKIMGNILKAI